MQFNKYTHTHTQFLRYVTPRWVTCSSMEWVDYRAGLRGYVQFNKYTHTHTQFLRYVTPRWVTCSSMEWVDYRAGLRGYVQFNKYTQLIPPREDQCEWHRMTRMTGPDCVVMCNLINTHTHTHTHTQLERWWGRETEGKTGAVTGRERERGWKR